MLPITMTRKQSALLDLQTSHSVRIAAPALAQTFVGENKAKEGARASLGRVTQLHSRLRLGRCRLRFGPDRFELGALDRGRLDPGRHLDRAGLIYRTPRTRVGDCARHQHLRSALVAKIAISEAHAGHRSAEADLIDRKSTRLNSSHSTLSRMPSSA